MSAENGSRVVVMYAMEEEAQFFYRYLTNQRDLEPVAGTVRKVRGEIDGLTVDVIITGIMAVHAAMATTATLTEASADAVLSVGCSGAHLPEQATGDIVIGKNVVPLAAEVISSTGKSRLCGVRCSMRDSATMAFDADELLLRLGTAAAESVRDSIAREGAAHVPRVDVSTVGSSDVWRQSPAIIAQTHANSGSACEEMEAHAVAQVCQAFGTPFLAVKDIANSEINPEPIQLEPTHSLVPGACQVGVNAGRVAAKLLGLMAADDDYLARCATAGATRAAKRGRAPATADGSLKQPKTATA